MMKTSIKKIPAPSRSWGRYLAEHYELYIMLIPVILFYFIFRYVPMYGLLIAFKEYNIFKGVSGSEWVGLDVFGELFGSDRFWKSFASTIRLNILSLIAGFPAPIILAFMLNEVRNHGFKRIIQSISYLPHFLSWVIIYGLALNFFVEDKGLVNTFLKSVGLSQIPFLTDKAWWLATFVGTSIWKEVGWGTILYLAALTAIDPQLYEAAEIDGAGRFRRMWHISLPGIRSTISILLILKIGQMLTTGFEGPFLMGNGLVSEVSEVLPVYIYYVGIMARRYSLTTAAGLFLAVGNLILLLGADGITRRIGGEGLFGGRK